MFVVDGQKYEIKLFKRISFCFASIGTRHRCVKEKVNLDLYLEEEQTGSYINRKYDFNL